MWILGLKQGKKRILIILNMNKLFVLIYIGSFRVKTTKVGK